MFRYIYSHLFKSETTVPSKEQQLILERERKIRERERERVKGAIQRFNMVAEKIKQSKGVI